MNIKGIAIRFGAVLAVAVAGVLWVGCTEDKGTGQETYYTLDVEINPPGGGSVELSPPEGRYRAGFNVLVTATPNEEYGCTFAAWSGDWASMESRTNVPVNGNLILFANFDCTGEPPPPPPPPPPPTGDNEPVRIGDLMWTKNLNINTADSWCYDDDPANCAIYGRLYTWEAAKSACASLGGGWRLPSNEDWDNLVEYAGGWEVVGRKLKATSGWNRCYEYDGEEEDCVDNGNGTDDYGFSALPGGDRGTGGSFGGAGDVGFWWSATENDAGGAYYRVMGFVHDYAVEYWGSKSIGFSARCVGVVQD